MVSIRPYIPADHADVKRNLEDGLLYEEEIDSPETLRKKIEAQPRSILVAEEDGKAVGNVIICYDGWVGFIWHLAVRKEYRCRNIGPLS